MSEYWVIADVPQRAYELLAKARELAGDDRVTCFLAGDEAAGQEAIASGADEAVLIPIPEAGLWEAYAAPLAERAKADKPKAILASASRRGKDLAAQLAALLDAPLASDCKKMEADGDGFKLERMMFAGMASAELDCAAETLAATFAPRSFDAPAPDSGRTGEVTSLAGPDGAAKVTQRTPKQTEGVELGEADLVVGIGRGFDDESQIGLAKDAAAALGAELACSRPIAEFFKWLPEDRYLGISGQQIRGRLYLAAGISGQVQHLYGIRDVKTIVAVNSDPKAPILDVADYYVVGDLKEFLPAFTEAVKTAKG